MIKKHAPTPTATSVAPEKPLTPEQIKKLRRDQKQLRAIIRALNMSDVGDTSLSPAAKVRLLLRQREEHRNAIVQLIARKTPQPYL